MLSFPHGPQPLHEAPDQDEKTRCKVARCTLLIFNCPSFPNHLLQQYNSRTISNKENIIWALCILIADLLNRQELFPRPYGMPSNGQRSSSPQQSSNNLHRSIWTISSKKYSHHYCLELFLSVLSTLHSTPA